MRVKKLLIFLLLVSIFLCSCNDADMLPADGVIAVSGSLSYYAAMDESQQNEQLLNRRIEITGTVSGDGITTIFVGEEKKDGISFSCTFSANTPELEKVKTGSNVRLHGVCTSIVGNCIYLDHCMLTEPPHTTTDSAANTSASSTPTTDVLLALPTTTSQTTIPTTLPPTTPSSTTTPPTPSLSTTVAPATTSPTTTPPAIIPSTAVPTTPAPTVSAEGILFVKWPETVSRNEIAEVTIQAKPNTQYTITVYYKSGPSTAKGLEPQTSDSNGYVTWTWKVGGKTSPGTFRITVSGGGEQKAVTFTVKTN